MLRLLGFRPPPIVSVLVGGGVIAAGLVADKRMLTVVGAVVVLMGLPSALGGRSDGSGSGSGNRGPR